MNPEIKSSTNYSQFSFIPGNRNLSRGHLRKLSASIVEENLLAQHPIIVNERLQIIDGQHRFEVAKLHNLTVYYIISDVVSAFKEISLSQIQKPWKLDDFVNMYVYLDNDNYKQLKDFSSKYQIGIGIGASLLTHRSIGHGAGVINQQIRLGTFTVTHFTDATAFMESIEKIKPSLATGVYRDRHFLEAMRIIKTLAPIEEMVEKINQREPLFPMQIGVKDYLQSLEEMYNENRTTHIRFF
jgi:hypothetical protein